MRKLLFLLTLACLSSCVLAEDSWLGIYMQGSKVGYAHSTLTDTTLNKVPAKKSESSTVMNAGLLGAAMSLRIDSTSWSDTKGRPILMKFTVESAGRKQTTNALFTSKDIRLTINNSGAQSTKTIPLPKDGSVVDDAVSALLEKGAATGQKAYFYVLDPMIAQLVKNEVTLKGQAKTTVNGKEASATLVEISEPRATMKAFLSGKGDLIKVEGPMGMEMLPMTQAEAMKDSGEGSTSPKTDLAYSTSIKPNKPIENVSSLKDLKLRIIGHDLSALPSNAHQTVSRQGESWLVDIHPVQFSSSGVSPAKAAQQKPEWVKPGFNVPSASPSFKALAKKVVGNSPSVREAAGKVRAYVYGMMKPNAGIGVLRDASEVLQTKEGVCRDYAVLTATLLRAAHVPAKVVSGLVYAEGSFFYHAWVTVWDGKNWVGVDSTLPAGRLTAGHIELSEGNVEEAFTFTFLEKVKVEVLHAG